MNLQEYAKLIRNRWLTVVICTIITVAGAAAITYFTTPLYQATAKLLIPPNGGSPATYAQLITSEPLAIGTIESLGLSMTPDELRKRARATAPPNANLISISVLDPSPSRARDLANALSERLVALVALTEIPAAGRKPDTRAVVVQPATTPADPTIPRPKLNLAIGIAGGLLLGIGIAVLRDRFDTKIKDRQSIESLTSAGVLASIPFDRTTKKDPRLPSTGNPPGVTEPFRALRANLRFLDVDSRPRVLLVTSPNPYEGKTATAMNLALALAEADESVVLVDADLRKPSIHESLAPTQSSGLSTVLSGQDSFDEVIRKTTSPELSVITAGAPPPNPIELLGSQACRDLLKHLRNKFDYIVVDCSPLLVFADAGLLSALSDGVILAVQYGKTDKEDLAECVTLLNNTGARLLGSVITMAEPATSTSNQYLSYEEEPTRALVRGIGDLFGKYEPK